MRIIYNRLCMSRPMWPVCACMRLILVMFHVIHITLTRDLETYTIYACHPFVLPRVHLWRKISINDFARRHQKKVCVAEANNNKMSPLDWYILVGLAIMLPRSFLQEHCVPAIQRTSDNSLSLASQQDQEYSIGCDSCHCDLRRCFAMYICLGVTSMMYYIKTLRDLQKGKVSIFPDCKCSACVGTPVFEKVWVLATLTVF